MSREFSQPNANNVEFKIYLEMKGVRDTFAAETKDYIFRPRLTRKNTSIVSTLFELNTLNASTEKVAARL